MLPRMLLHRKPRGGQIFKKQLLDRFDRFDQGQWTSLMRESKNCDERASVGRRRGNRRRQGNNVEERVTRAEMLVHMGERERELKRAHVLRASQVKSLHHDNLPAGASRTRYFRQTTLPVAKSVQGEEHVQQDGSERSRREQTSPTDRT